MIEVEEDYLIEMVETINKLCEANKVYKDQIELLNKLVDVLRERL